MKFTEDKRNFVIIFSILFFLYLWDGFLSGNEAQTLANVYRFAHPDWLKNDWFLSLDTVYRIPFNLFLYIPAKVLNLSALAFFSRLLLLVLMSLSLTNFFKTVKLSAGSIALFTLITFRMKGMMAGEDMLWHVEAKVLSYILVISGITSLLKGKHRSMWLFFGGAVAFHPLVGGYSVIALVFSMIFYRKNENLSLIKKSPFFILTGWPGTGIILYNLVTSKGASGGTADLIYVARHPHHMVPPDFFRHVHKSFPPWLDYTILIGNLVFCAAILILAFLLLKKNTKERKLLNYTIGSIAILIAGMLLYFTGQYHLLKYYPFRFPDVIVPFTAYILFFYGIDRLILFKRVRNSMVTAILIMGITGGLFVFQTFSLIRRNIPLSMLNENSNDRELNVWIKNNTPPDSSIIIDPHIDNFNITAERAQFVTFKHIPQSEKDVIQWYERLKKLNSGKDFYRGKISFDLSGFDKNYLSLTDKELKMIGSTYGQDYYIGPADREGDLNRVYRNGRWGVYLLGGN